MTTSDLFAFELCGVKTSQPRFWTAGNLSRTGSPNEISSHSLCLQSQRDSTNLTWMGSCQEMFSAHQRRLFSRGTTCQTWRWKCCGVGLFHCIRGRVVWRYQSSFDLSADPQHSSHPPKNSWERRTTRNYKKKGELKCCGGEWKWSGRHERRPSDILQQKEKGLWEVIAAKGSNSSFSGQG